MTRPVRRAPVEVDKNERYTLPEDDARCRALARVSRWNLDVAACRESHLAPKYFTKADDGLARRWTGRAVWCNPPWETLEPWVIKAWVEMARARGAKVIAMLLPAVRTEQPFWSKWVEPFRDGKRTRQYPPLVPELAHQLRGVTLESHFLEARLQFGHPGNAAAEDVGSPPFGIVLLVFRRRA
jgi:hypothetical protein